MTDAMTERQRIGLALRDPLPWRDLAMVVGTAEETGFEAEALFSVDAIFDIYKPGRGTVEAIVPFAAQVGDGADPILSDEHDDWRWASLDEALALVPYEPQREALGRISADLLERPEAADLYRIEIPPGRREKTR